MIDAGAFEADTFGGNPRQVRCCKVVRAHSYPQFCFEIRTASGRRSEHVFEVDTMADLQAWMKTLKEASELGPPASPNLESMKKKSASDLKVPAAPSGELRKDVRGWRRDVR